MLMITITVLFLEHKSSRMCSDRIAVFNICMVCCVVLFNLKSSLFLIWEEESRINLHGDKKSKTTGFLWVGKMLSLFEKFAKGKITTRCNN
jgi:hypothetical protein